VSELDHTDVGAYALGILDEPDRAAFEAHLQECGRCRAELDDLQGVRSVLDDVRGDPDSAPPLPSPGAAPQPHQRPDRRPPSDRPGWWLLAAAAVVALLSLGGWTILDAVDDEPGPSDHAPAGELLLTGERFSGTDPDTGVTGIFAVESRVWGTHVAFEVRGVRGPLECDVVAVDAAGEEDIAGSWSVPAPGYGVPGGREPLVLHGPTGIDRDELDRLEIRTAAGDVLLSVTV
jgi:anti-sigma factor RsiW